MFLLSNFFFQAFAFAGSCRSSSSGQRRFPGKPPVPISTASMPQLEIRSSIWSSSICSKTGSNTPIGIFRLETDFAWGPALAAVNAPLGFAGDALLPKAGSALVVAPRAATVPAVERKFLRLGDFGDDPVDMPALLLESGHGISICVARALYACLFVRQPSYTSGVTA